MGIKKGARKMVISLNERKEEKIKSKVLVLEAEIKEIIEDTLLEISEYLYESNFNYDDPKYEEALDDLMETINNLKNARKRAMGRC
jgi:hypothetical protein